MTTKVIAKVVLFNADGQILALKRSLDDKVNPGQWDFPGGGIEPGEGIEEGTIRETLEEAGLELKAQDLQLVHAATGVTDRNLVWLYFVGLAPEGEIILSPEHSDYKWMPLKEALEVYKYPIEGQLMASLVKNQLIPAPAA